MQHSVSVSAGLWVKIGSRHENEEELGYTHFLEHMLFKGTKKRTSREQAEEIERVGGYMNAVTSREYTYFYATLIKSEIELGFDLLSDMVFQPLLNEKDIKNESDVILEEMKSYEDSPDEYVHDFFYRKIFPTSRLGGDIIGTVDSVKGVTDQKLRNYFEKYYYPENMILSVSGNFNFSEIMILAEKYFSAKIGIGPATYNYPEVKKDFSVNFENKDLEQINFVLAAQGFKRDFDSSVVSSLVTSIIGGGMSSRLFQRIREELGLCYSINCYSSSYFDTGITSISCGTSKEKFMFCVESIMAELRRLVKDGFTESELRDAKSSQIGAMAIGFELPEQRMGSLALQEIYFSRFYNFEERKAAMEKVTLEMLNAKMREIFNLKSLHLSGVGDLGKSIIPDNLVIF